MPEEEHGSEQSVTEDQDGWRVGVAPLYDRLSRALEKNSGLYLSAAEVDLIALTGAFKAISDVLSAH